MNYLAHLYLADPDDPPAQQEFLIGNLLGDFAKGRLDDDARKLYGAQRLAGIRLHRAIDSFTDGHPTVRASKNRLRPELRRFAGIIVDVYYDHLLVDAWNDYSPLPLPQFCRQVYVTLQNQYHSLPARMQRSVNYMLANDLLQSYRDVDGVAAALAGIARKFSRPTKLHDAAVDLHRHHDDFRRDFASFFPQLIAYAKQQKASLTGSEQ